MYDKIFADMQDKMKPAMEVLEINGGAVEKLFQQQSNLINDLVQSGMEHSKAVAETKDLTALAELQKTYFADLSQKLMDAAKLNLDVMVEAKDAITKVVEASFKGVQAPAKAAAEKPAAAPKKAAKSTKAAAEKPAEGEAAAA